MSKLFCQVAAGSDGTDGGLVAACRDGDLVQLQMMLASGVSPDAQDADGQRPLILSQKKSIRHSFAVTSLFLCHASRPLVCIVASLHCSIQQESYKLCSCRCFDWEVFQRSKFNHVCLFFSETAALWQ